MIMKVRMALTGRTSMTTTSQRWRFTGAAIAATVLAGGIGTSPAHAETGKQVLDTPSWRQFKNPGSYEFDLPAGVDSFTVTMVGGGGGGGGAGVKGSFTGGGGGGGGGAGIAKCTVTKFPAELRTIAVRVGGGGGGGQKGTREGKYGAGGGGGGAGGAGGTGGGSGGVPGNRNDGGGAGGGGGGGDSAVFFLKSKAPGDVISVGAAGGGGGGGGGAGWANGQGPARGGSGGSGSGGARGGAAGSDARKTPIGGHAGAGGRAQCDSRSDIPTTGKVADGTDGGDADNYTAGTAGKRLWFEGLPGGVPKDAGRGAAGGSGGESNTDGATARGGYVIVYW
ncbi:hypothetical protein [Streptomyces xanthophaeus]|uniref:hypothetical protein n=1 Tax=Streptomyces xanthophaeus TaxID=67385 RepID=UPI003667C408